MSVCVTGILLQTGSYLIVRHCRPAVHTALRLQPVIKHVLPGSCMCSRMCKVLSNALREAYKAENPSESRSGQRLCHGEVR
jgi:hypothetical protein